MLYPICIRIRAQFFSDKMDINQTIGRRIKEVRLERKLSREQVARRCEVCQQTIEKYEKGKIEISVSRLIRIANILNVGIMYLLAPDNKDNPVFQHFIAQQVGAKKESLE